ncbi:hypothetical protein BDN72DRAFT_249367 [Pluteus cervinus]|uniref:Uncharacterized protein n=1 Tax=Pluteus cervinus TaxID=181527 RepID=A0ACD3B5C8_9AGAR|nr:hypothetical protein BDN72DRAFT_249367 [Pluteus cervinus]
MLSLSEASWLILSSDKLGFHSSICISPASKLFQSLLLASTRPEALSRLPPLSKSAAIPPTPSNPTTSTSSNESAADVHSSSPNGLTTLPVPPRHTILSSLAASHPSTSSLASSAASATVVGSLSSAYPPASKPFSSLPLVCQHIPRPRGLQVQTGRFLNSKLTSTSAETYSTTLHFCKQSTSRSPDNSFVTVWEKWKHLCCYSTFNHHHHHLPNRSRKLLENQWEGGGEAMN